MRTGGYMGQFGHWARDEVTDPFEATFGTPLFEFLQQRHEYGQAFEDFMVVRQSKATRWFDVFPMRSKIEGAMRSDLDVLLVAVASGQGHWAQGFRRAMPSQEYYGRVIVQGQTSLVSRIYLDGIEAMAYDFFTLQPVNGAQFYLFKQVIHDWDDKKAIQILRNTADSMAREHSTLLVHDCVLPEDKVGLQATCMDIGMMMANGGCERTETQWRIIVSAAGLNITRIWYPAGGKEGSEAVIECRIN